MGMTAPASYAASPVERTGAEHSREERDMPRSRKPLEELDPTEEKRGQQILRDDDDLLDGEEDAGDDETEENDEEDDEGALGTA
jgi:hypothetical protein